MGLWRSDGLALVLQLTSTTWRLSWFAPSPAAPARFASVLAVWLAQPSFAPPLHASGAARATYAVKPVAALAAAARKRVVALVAKTVHGAAPCGRPAARPARRAGRLSKQLAAPSPRFTPLHGAHMMMHTTSERKRGSAVG